jgi:hypothetical protein
MPWEYIDRMRQQRYASCCSRHLLLDFDYAVMSIIETAKFTVSAQHTTQILSNFRAANYAVSAHIHGVNSLICNG